MLISISLFEGFVRKVDPAALSVTSCAQFVRALRIGDKMYLSRYWGNQMGEIALIRRACLLGVFLFSLSACFPTSQYPISGEPMDNLGATFSGLWEGMLGDGPVTVLFIQQSQDDTGTHHIGGLVIGHHAENLSLNEGWLEFEAEVSVVSGETFLSARLVQMDGTPTPPEERDYHLFRLLLEEGSMTLVGLDDMVSAELVERGALQGTVDRSSPSPTIKLTSDGEDLRAFLTNADLEEVFSGVFARFTRRR
jgi:hypothetical protein